MGEKSAAAALRRIAEKKALFVTRGDHSGTHVKEMEIWEAAGIKPSGSWYKLFEKGNEGNSGTLAFADKIQAYTIMDRATYLTMKKGLKSIVLVEKDEALLNFISVIPVNQARCPRVHASGVDSFLRWLQSERTAQIIHSFGMDVYGEPLYFPISGIKIPK